MGIAEIAGKPEDEFATGTRTTWLLLVIFTGLLGLAAYVLVGKKRPPSQAAIIANSQPKPRGQENGFGFGPNVPMASMVAARDEASGASKQHKVDHVSPSRFTCRTCEFSTADLLAAERHALIEGDFPGPPAEQASPDPELRSCPDCAEHIRFAARKCRFCGYMFEDAAATNAKKT